MPRPVIQITNCDWLSFSCCMPLTDEERRNGLVLQQPDGYKLLEQKSGTNLFKRRALLFNDMGDKILTLLWEPYSNIIKSDNVFVEISNRLLYTGYKHIPELLNKLHFNYFSSLSRLDLCTDFNPTKSQSAVIDMLQNGKAYIQGKREGSMFHDFKQGQYINRTPRQLSWGSPATLVKFKLYNKSLEIHSLDAKGRTWCNKPYIESMWRLNGLNPDNVWRLEVSIMSSSTQQWRGEKLDWTTAQPENYTPLFYDLVATRFVVRKNEGHTHKRYDTILPFLDIPDTAHYRLRKADPKQEQKHTDHAATLRNLMKELDRPEVQCNKPIAASLLGSVQTLLDTAKLHGYFYRAIGKNFDEWCENYCKNLPI